MSRVNAREAITAYFTNAGLPNVGTVYAARPLLIEETAYTETLLGQAVAETVNGSSMVLVVNMPTDSRLRRADTGRGAVNDTEIHKAALELFFASDGGDAVAAQYDYDTTVDLLIALIRKDATFGGRLWSVGEYTAGVDHQQGMPYTDADGLTIFIVGLLHFEAWEWVAGNVNEIAP